ncbi:MAG: iron donor protein CyaY [Gammaproteobacteria bacterium]|nr:iron donor protein CyaY [Gammaproteobacteria bacterium]
MTESEFNQRVDDTLVAIEEAIDETGADIDYESAAGILTLTIEANGSQIILNRQTPVKQLWLATRQSGYHFDWSDEAGGWVLDSDGTPFTRMLNDALVDQGAEALELAG